MAEPIRELKFSIGSPGGWGGPGIIIHAKGSELHYWKDLRPTQPPTTCKQLSSQEYQRFLEHLAELDFWNWLAWYKPEHLILDGTVWSAHVRDGELIQTCSGENAYPADRNSKTVSTGEYSQRFIRFLNALGELVGDELIR